MSNVEKLHYLKSALKDNAAKKIKIFAINNANYEIAWETLRKAYEAKRAIISRHISMLLDLPMQQKESADGLSKLATDTRQIVASLDKLNVTVTPEITVRIIESKLHKNTREKWEEGLSRDTYPSLQSMYDFLDRYADVVSMRDIGNKKREHEQDTHVNKRLKVGNKKGEKHRAFVTIAAKNCIACQEKPHLLYQCDVFRKMAAKDRV